MEFNLTKEQQMIQSAARDYAEKAIAPLIEDIVEKNEVPNEIINGLKELDLFALPISDEYGGAGAGYASYVLAEEQLSRICPGVAVIVSVNNVGAAAMSIFGTEEQKRNYLPMGTNGNGVFSFAFTEPGTGSDPKQITATADRDGDFYVLNGTKRFITNSSYDGPMIFFAKDSETGHINGYIIDKFCEGYSISEPWKKMGVRGAPLYDVYLKDVKIPKENILGKPDQGFWILKVAMALGKIGICSIFLGAMLAAYEEGLAYATAKTHRGAPIAKFQAIQMAIADMFMKYEAARWMAYRIGYLADNARDKGDILKDSATAKIFITETAIDVARIALNIHGSYGLMEDYKISRVWKDVIFGPQVEGVSHLLKVLVAGEILKDLKG